MVPPVRDLPVALPDGERATYPVNPTVLDSLAETHGLASASDRLVRALTVNQGSG